MTPRAKWIGAIVGLLAGNVIATGALIAASHTGASRVIDGYYERAVHYDDAIDRAARTAKLGWNVELSLARDGAVISARDRDGCAITGARARVAATARARGGTIDLPLDDAGGGTYRARAALAPGWYDTTIVVERGGDSYASSIALEVK